mmetsp:Transcript_13854/g.39658  ORF Transcript_13854/g.39658 Transcript_13854/m.39658 type:complete len:133 (+) Transcript_13854:92-490(+)
MAPRLAVALLLGGLGAGAGLPAREPAARAGLERRRGSAGQLRVDGAPGPAVFAQLDSSVHRKRDGNYLVRAAGASQEPFEPPHTATLTSGETAPVASVDNTLPRPPDADGDPYNTPVWAENTPPPQSSSQSR